MTRAEAKLIAVPILKRILWFNGNCQAGLCLAPASHEVKKNFRGSTTFLYCDSHTRVQRMFYSNLIIRPL